MTYGPRLYYVNVKRNEKFVFFFRDTPHTTQDEKKSISLHFSFSLFISIFSDLSCFFFTLIDFQKEIRFFVLFCYKIIISSTHNQRQPSRRRHKIYNFFCVLLTMKMKIN